MSNQLHQLLFFLILTSYFFLSCEGTTTTNQEVIEKETIKMEETDNKARLLRHVVLFKFKEESKEEEVNKINEAFNALPDAIPVIKDFEWGLNDSPENFHQGFTHCYMLTFSSEEDRDSVYAPHPKHQEFVASLQPHLEKVFVVDYWANP